MKTTDSRPGRVSGSSCQPRPAHSPVLPPFHRWLGPVAKAATFRIARVAALALVALGGIHSAPAANILWVSDASPGAANNGVFSGPGTNFTDQGFVTLLQNAGHNVNRFNSSDSQNVT